MIKTTENQKIPQLEFLQIVLKRVGCRLMINATCREVSNQKLEC